MAKFSVATFLELQSVHKTDKAIGDIYGISKQAVYKFRQKHNILPYDKYGARNQDIRRKRRNGRSVQSLMNEYSLGKSIIYNILNGITQD